MILGKRVAISKSGRIARVIGVRTNASGRTIAIERDGKKWFLTERDFKGYKEGSKPWRNGAYLLHDELE